MAGLLDFLNSDDAKLGIGLLSAAGPSATPMSFGQRLQGAMQTMDADKMGKMKLDLVKAQIDNFNSEVAQRAAATQKMNDGLKLVSGLMNKGGAYQPGQLGSGSAGIMPNDNPFAPSQARGLAAATPEEIAAAKTYGIDLMDQWKAAKEGFEQKPGTFRVDATTGRREYVGDPTKGITYNNGQVGLMPGFTNATTATTLATELPKALLGAAGSVNLRKNEDGTETPVSALTENPTLQALIGQLAGGGGFMPQRAAPAGAIAPAPVAAPSGGASVSPQVQRTRDAESMQMIRQELANNPTIPADQRAGLEREIARLSASQGQQGFPTPSLVRVAGGAPRYGMTNEQQLAKDAGGKINESWLKSSYEPALSAGDTARDTLTNVQAARMALGNLGSTGWGTEAKASAAAVLAGLGVAPKNAEMFAANAQKFQSVAMKNLWTTLNAAKGPQTEGDAARASKTFAQLQNTPEANGFILDMMEAKAAWDQMRSQFYQQALPVAKGKGDLSEVDREWSKRAPSIFSMPVMQKWGSK